MLTSLGMERQAEAVYRAMLSYPGDGVADLSRRLEMTEEEVRSGLDRLSEMALVRPSHEKRGRLRAVSPDIGMEILLTRQQAELAAQQHRIEASRAAAAQLISEYADLRPSVTEPSVEHLVGLDRIRERLDLLQREVKDEVMVLAPDGEQTPANLEAAKPLDESLLGRGIRMRTVYLDSVRNSPHTVAYAEWLSGLGRQARTAPTLPIRLIITDRSTAVIPVNSDDTAAGGGDTHRPGHTDSPVRPVRVHLGDGEAVRRGDEAKRERLDRHGVDGPQAAGRRLHRRGHRQTAGRVPPDGPPRGDGPDGAPRRAQSF
ncbi:sugar-specific transcriptional regulator TrmB [Streptomyces sp. PvR018]